MSPNFIKWAEDQWPPGSRVEIEAVVWERLRADCDVRLSSGQAMSRLKTLIAFVNERWGATEPQGLATALAAIAFLKTEAGERDHSWSLQPFEPEDIENYLCTALDTIIWNEEGVGIDKSWELYPLDDSHKAHLGTSDEDTCEVCRRHYGFQDAHDNEIKDAIVSMVFRAHELACAVKES